MFSVGQKVRVFCRELRIRGRYGRVVVKFSSIEKPYIVRGKFGTYCFSESELKAVDQ